MSRWAKLAIAAAMCLSISAVPAIVLTVGVSKRPEPLSYCWNQGLYALCKDVRMPRPLPV